MPQIVVEFVPDFAPLEGGIEELIANGNISKSLADEFRKAGKTISEVSTAIATTGKITKQQMSDMAAAIKKLPTEFQKDFKAGVTDALKEAGVSAQEFEEALTGVIGAEKTLKQELRQTIEALAQMKLAGADGTQAYHEMAARAGELRDAMGDAAAEVNNFASDTQNLDSVISIMTGVAAAFSVAQGATALLGQENEDLEKSMQKLQASMSILMGIQQVANLLQRDSAAIAGVVKVQRLLGVAAVNLETAAESKNIVVKGAATIATRILNAAMKANPVFILVAAFTALTAVIAYFSRTTVDSSAAVDGLNSRMETLTHNLEVNAGAIKTQGDLILKQMELQGAKGSQLAKQQIQNNKDLIADNNRSMSVIDAAMADINNDTALSAKTKGDKIKELLKQQDAYFKNNLDLISQNQGLEIDVKIKVKDESEETQKKLKDAADKRKADLLKQAETNKKIREQELQDAKSLIEAELLSAEDGSKKQLDLRIKLAKAEADLGGFNAKSAAEKTLVHAKFLADIEKLNNDYNEGNKKKSIEAQQAILTAMLNDEQLAADERERLTVAVIQKASELEILEAKGNTEKIRAIRIKEESDIAKARLDIRRAAFAQEEALADSQDLGAKRRLALVADNEQEGVDARIAAVNQLEFIEEASIQRRIDNYKKLYDAGLIGEKEYVTAVAGLQDQLVGVIVESNQKRTQLTKEETAKRLEEEKKEIDAILNMASEVLNAFGNIAAGFNEREQQQIEERKRKLQEEKEVGAITEKDYKLRMKRLEVEEIAAKTRQAKRDKALNLFQAVIAGARAVVEALPNPFAVAFAVAMSLAQIAAIVAKPIPKFGKGTKNAPRGYAEVGETGTEIVQTEKGYYLAEHPQIVWFKGGEKVYNPSETRDMLTATPKASKSAMQKERGSSSRGINTKKLASEIGAEFAKQPKTVINLDEKGFTSHVIKQGSVQEYKNKRYTFK